MITIMIVDDHPIVREGLGMMFDDGESFSVVASCASGEEAIEWCRKQLKTPDIILSDVRMPGMDGFKMFEKLKRHFPDGARLVFLAGLPNKDEEEKARAMGAKGYMAKTTNTAMLADAMRGIASGKVDFATDDYVPSETPFTDKELETLKYFALGKTREEIAIILGCSVETIKSRASSIRRKLDVVNMTAAVSRAHELGYLR